MHTTHCSRSQGPQDILKLYYYYHWFSCTFTIDAECRVQLSALILITGTLMQIRTKTKEYKFALLWGEAQKKNAYSYLKVT